MKDASKVKVLAALMVGVCAATLSSCAATEGTTGSCFINVNGSEPEENFHPLTTFDAAGLRLASVLHSGLVFIDETNQPQMDLAESIQPLSPTLYEVTLKSDLKFSDGTPLTAKNFVDTWNYAVANETYWAPQFDNIAGYAVGQETLSGLTVFSNKTFTIELSEPRSDFIAALAHPAFLPLPTEALTDIDAYKKNLVTSGPYQIDTWVHSQYLTVVPFADYRGGREVHNDGIRFQLYQRSKKPYEDFQAGDLDILDSFATKDFLDYQQRSDKQLAHQPGPAIITLSIHAETPHFTGVEGQLRRQALSMAIDREALAEDTLDSSHIAAEGFVPPSVPRATTMEPPATVRYDPEQALHLWRQADAISPFTGTIPVHFSHDISANRQWGKVVAKQIEKVLGVAAEPIPGADFVRFRYDYQDVRFDGLYRTGWTSDYPSMREYLVPNFATDGSSNDTRYSNPQVDQLFDAANIAVDNSEALRLYGEAEQILLSDLPAIPLLYPAVNTGWGDSVGNVYVGFNSFPLYHLITKNSDSCV